MVINLTDSFIDSFGIVDIMTGGGPARATDLMVYKIYFDGFKGLDYSGAAAQSIILMLLVIALTFVAVPLRRAARPLPVRQAMIERTPILNIVTPAAAVPRPGAGAAALRGRSSIAATHDFHTVNQVPMPLVPGQRISSRTWRRPGAAPISAARCCNSFDLRRRRRRSARSFIAALSAFSIVYFRYRGRMLMFWLIFITLMLPLEVRIVPTYAVAANALRPFQSILDLTGLTWLVEQLTGMQIALKWGLLNSYTGLILPLVATATGTFLYRQFFLTAARRADRGGARWTAPGRSASSSTCCCRCRAPTWRRSAPSCSSGRGTSICGRCWSPPTTAHGTAVTRAARS